MFPLPPIVAAALVAVALLLATRLRPPDPIARALRWGGGTTVTALGWYVLGALLGPGLGVLSRGMVDAFAPVLAVAIGWAAARAGAELARPEEERGPWSLSEIVAAIAAFLVPMALLTAAARVLLMPSIEHWTVIGPAIATLAGALALAGAGTRRLTPGSFVLVLAAVIALFLLPDPSRADLKRLGLAAGVALAGVALCTVIAARLAHRASLLPGTIAALCLAAGIGVVSRLTSLVVCGMLGFALARRSLPHARLAAELRIHEPLVAALLWTFAGASLGGPPLAVAVATGLVALWPVGRRVIAGAAHTDGTLGLAIALGFALSAGPALGEWSSAVPTVAALGFLVVRVIPVTGGTSERLTPPARRVEVSA